MEVKLIVFEFVDSDPWLSALIVVFVVVDVLASLVVKPQRQFWLYCPVEVVLEETAEVVLLDLCLVLVEVVLVGLVRQYWWELVEKVAVLQGESVQVFELLALLWVAKLGNSAKSFV